MLTEVSCTFWSNELKTDLMYFITVKCSCRVFYASHIFQRISALPKPWMRTSFTRKPGAAVAFWVLPNTPLLSVGGASLREKKCSVHSLHHISSWPHYWDHLQGRQLVSAALCWTGIYRSARWEPHLRQPHGQPLHPATRLRQKPAPFTTKWQ